MQHDIVGQNPLHRPAKGAAIGIARRAGTIAIDPVGQEGRDDAVARGKARHTGADRRNRAGQIRQRRERFRLGRRQSKAEIDQQLVAVIEGSCRSLDQDFTGPRRWHLGLGQFEIVASGAIQRPAFHRLRHHLCPCMPRQPG